MTPRYERQRDLVAKRADTPFDQVPHGELGYTGYGCHCDVCKGAEAARQRGIRRRVRGRLHFDQYKLARIVDNFRHHAGLSWLDVSKETGVDHWSLQHLEDGVVLSSREVIKLMIWANVVPKMVTSKVITKKRDHD